MATMTVRELVKELMTYPGNWEVMIEVRGQEAWATDVDLQSGGVSAWVTITDYPIRRDDDRATGKTD